VSVFPYICRMTAPSEKKARYGWVSSGIVQYHEG